MLKVECEACKAPYQVDERRVPPTGLKMRCPKCGHAFTVTNPDAKPSAQPPVSKQTIMGVAAPSLSSAPDAPEIDMDDILPQVPAPKPAAAKPALPRPAPPKPPPPKAAPPPPKAAAAPALGEIDELLDLPAMPPPAPPAVKPLPPVKPTLASPGSQAKPVVPSLSDFEIDLPSATADLPATRGPAPKAAPKATAKAPTAGGALDFEVDLPSAATAPPRGNVGLPATRQEVGLPAPRHEVGLPAARGEAGLPVARGEAGLPVARGEAGLPVARGEVGLPAAFGGVGLPAVGGFGSIDLPTAGAAGLPTALGGSALPMPAQGNLPAPVHGGGLPVALGGSSLPSAIDQGRYLPQSGVPGGNLPTAVGADQHLPANTDALPAALGDARYLPSTPGGGEAPFGEADFGDLVGGGGGGGSGASGAPAAPKVSRSGGQGGVGFGELDFGGSGGDSVAMDDDAAGRPASLGPPMGGEMALPGEEGPVRTRERVVISQGQGRVQKIAVVAIAVAFVAGGALELTPTGAFGRHVFSDFWNSSGWSATATSTMAKARTDLDADLYDKSRAAVESVANVAASAPRAQVLAAAAALTEFEFQLRFGRDAGRSTRADTWLKAIAKARSDPGKVMFYSAAAGGRAAAQGDLPAARTLLETAAGKNTGDPVQEDVALLRGEVELLAQEPAAATKAFTRALQVAPSAHAHYGLARAYALSGDHDKAKSEIALTLTATPNHPGAMILKAKLDWDDDRNEVGVIGGLKPLLDGAAKVSASPAELSRAYTLTGLAQAARGDAGSARTAFDAALKFDASNVDALLGQGDVFFADGRYTEALSRFETAVQSDPKNPLAIVDDAKAKIQLERFVDAKNQLAAAHTSMPKNLIVTYWLGRAEEALGNKKGAEENYIGAIALGGPKDRDSILPYVALSTLFEKEGRATEAQAKLDEARAKLPDSAAMQRALGEVSAAQGLYDDAIAHFKAAAAKEPNDLRSIFQLGETYLRMRRLDDASAQFDKVAAADKDYPNLGMRRGDLLEESGHIDQALEQFKAALDKAPHDVDLQLRVGAAYVGVGRGEDAFKILKPVYDQRQSSAEVNHYLGRAHLLRGGSHLVDAIRYLSKAVDMDPTRPEYHLYLAWAAIESKDLKLGQDEVDRAIAMDALMGDAYWQRAVIEEIKGAVDDAIRDAQKALQLHPSRNDAHATLAKAYSDKNMTKEALAEWAVATSRTSDHPDWEYFYGRMLFDKNNLKEALPHVLLAAKSAETMEPSPGWMAQAEFMAAKALLKQGNKVDAKEHFIRYQEKAERSSPDQQEARAALHAIDPNYHQ